MLKTKQETIALKRARIAKENAIELALGPACEDSNEDCVGDVGGRPYYGDKLYFCEYHGDHRNFRW